MKRTENIAGPVFDAWAEALSTATEGEADRKQAFLLLPKVNRVFVKDRLQIAALKRLITRLRSLPPAVVSQWADAKDIEAGEAALALIQRDNFFAQDKFQSRAFRAALKARARRKW